MSYSLGSQGVWPVLCFQFSKNIQTRRRPTRVTFPRCLGDTVPVATVSQMDLKSES